MAGMLEHMTHLQLESRVAWQAFSCRKLRDLAQSL